MQTRNLSRELSHRGGMDHKALKRFTHPSCSRGACNHRSQWPGCQGWRDSLTIKRSWSCPRHWLCTECRHWLHHMSQWHRLHGHRYRWLLTYNPRPSGAARCSAISVQHGNQVLRELRCQGSCVATMSLWILTRLILSPLVQPISLQINSEMHSGTKVTQCGWL